jgi:pimeloyl-ACP methyl ester carboxylesterase
MVLCYDYTGYYSSEGKNMTDYTQAVRDLDAVLTYLETSNRFNQIPILLYGHSLGAYVSAAVLIFHHKITAVVAASGFDKPVEQWNYSVKRFSGRLGTILGAMAAIYLRVVFGKDTVRFSAVDGINSTNIPVLVISGTEDVFYGGKSPVYIKQDKITNPNCRYILMDQERHNGHCDYMLTDRALDYKKLCQENKISSVDKWLIMESDQHYFDQVHAFFLSASSIERV